MAEDNALGQHGLTCDSLAFEVGDAAYSVLEVLDHLREQEAERAQANLRDVGRSPIGHGAPRGRNKCHEELDKSISATWPTFIVTVETVQQ